MHQSMDRWHIQLNRDLKAMGHRKVSKPIFLLLCQMYLADRLGADYAAFLAEACERMYVDGTR